MMGHNLNFYREMNKIMSELFSVEALVNTCHKWPG